MLRSLHIPVSRKDETDDESGYASLISAFFLIVTVALIVLFGLTMLYSTSSGISGATLFIKQSIWAFIGLSLAIIVIIIGYKNLSNFSTLLLIVSAIEQCQWKPAHTSLRKESRPLI